MQLFQQIINIGQNATGTPSGCKWTQGSGAYKYSLPEPETGMLIGGYHAMFNRNGNELMPAVRGGRSYRHRLE
jgi:hypothetical protein